MPSLQHIKKRLRGVGNIHQITSAMELVAATKMRRAQEVALASRAYAVTALEILADLVETLDVSDDRTAPSIRHPLLERRPVTKSAILIIASDKGLVGAFNSSVFRKVEKWLAHKESLRSFNPQFSIFDSRFIAVGQKSVDYCRRKGYPIEAQFTNYGDIIHLHETEELATLLMNGFLEGRWDEVATFSSHFFSALRQEVIPRQLLPTDFAKIRATVEEIIPETGRYSELRQQLVASRPRRFAEYIIEPTPKEALEALVPALFKMQVYHLILEANASEHSARRVTMKNASDNANELIGELTKEYNRTRQTVITKELSEITGTMSAMR